MYNYLFAALLHCKIARRRWRLAAPFRKGNRLARKLAGSYAKGPLGSTTDKPGIIQLKQSTNRGIEAAAQILNLLARR